MHCCLSWYIHGYMINMSMLATTARRSKGHCDGNDSLMIATCAIAQVCTGNGLTFQLMQTQMLQVSDISIAGLLLELQQYFRQSLQLAEQHCATRCCCSNKYLVCSVGKMSESKSKPKHRTGAPAPTV
jgi:hypothetical protein